MAHSNELGALRDSHVSDNCTDVRNSHSSIPRHASSTNGNTKENGENIPPVLSGNESSTLSEEVKPHTRPLQPKFETFMMTGDLIINLNTQSSNSNLAVPVNCRKISETVTSHKQSSSSSTEEDKTDQKLQNKSNTREGPQLYSPFAEKKGNVSCSGNFVRTSKSEDYLQKVSVSTVNIDIEDNIATSLNTLLDTNKDNPTSDRIVWTYNAPVPSTGPKSPSSPMSSNSDDFSSGGNSQTNSPVKISCSASEIIPLDSEYVNGTSFICNISDSDIDQTNSCAKLHNCDKLVNELVSEKLRNNMFTSSTKSRYDPRTIQPKQDGVTNIIVDENKIYVKVLPDNRNSVDMNAMPVARSDKIVNNSSFARTQVPDNHGDQKLNNELSKHDENNLTDEELRRCYSPTEDESDVESLHSFHYSPKAIDMPSASRLAKRLYNLEGFKKSDVSRHLCKNNDFSRVVAEEYLKFFEFNGESLDVALRKFLKQFCLIGETQERERVLVHFSKRFLDCNPGAFKSQDAAHTLTCALMLLNTDLHGENVGRRMTCGEFVENLAELNEGENFPKDVLKSLYHSIKSTPLEWAVDEEEESPAATDEHINSQDQRQSFIGHNPFLEVPNPNCATEYKKGYVMRKCCVDPNGKKTPIGKRSWKMFYATLRDLVLYLHKDENGFRKNQLYDSLHNSIRIHHALATKATDYTKKRNVFRLQTADQAEYLFQTRYLKDANQDDSKELQSWIDTINYVAASLSAAAFAGGIGSSQKKFQRPLLPVSHSKLNFREQLLGIESGISRLEKELEEHLSHQPDRSAKSRVIHEFVEKETFLQFELKRYRTYAFLLRSKMAQFPELEPPLVETSIGEVDEPLEKTDMPINPTTTSANNLLNNVNVKRSLSDRYSYRAAIYKTAASDGSV